MSRSFYGHIWTPTKGVFQFYIVVIGETWVRSNWPPAVQNFRICFTEPLAIEIGSAKLAVKRIDPDDTSVFRGCGD
jgi:hypothetical protein